MFAIQKLQFANRNIGLNSPYHTDKWVWEQSVTRVCQNGFVQSASLSSRPGVGLFMVVLQVWDWGNSGRGAIYRLGSEYRLGQKAKSRIQRFSRGWGTVLNLKTLVVNHSQIKLDDAAVKAQGNCILPECIYP